MNNETTERWALAMGLERALKTITNGKDPDSERAQLDAQLLADYAEGRADRMPIRINGVEVCKLTIRKTEGGTVGRLYLDDAKRFVAWLCDDGRQYLEAFLSVPKCAEMLLKFCVDSVLLDGEVPAGTEYAAEEVPDSITTSVVGYKPEKMAKAFGADLPSAIAALVAGDE